jgi:ABC-type branched-subunit amino acid transport system substrate-binding protein
LDAAVAAERSGDVEAALRLYREVATQYPQAPEAAHALVAAADLDLRLGRRESARTGLEDVAFRFPAHPAARKAKLLLARMDLQDGRTSEGVSAMRTAYQDIQDPREKGRAATEIAASLAANGEAQAAVVFLAEAEQVAQGADKEAVRQQVLELVDGVLGPREVLALRETIPPTAWTHHLLNLKLGRLFVHVGDDARAQEALERYLRADPQGPFAPGAQATLAAIQQRSLVAVNKVGVLLPLSGKYEQAGLRMLAALNLGFQQAAADAVAAGQTTPPPAPVELVPVDEAADPAAVAKAVDTLVQEHRVMAIVGAVTLQGAREAALRAEALRVPLLTMARREGLPDTGPWTFHLGLTDEKQARAVARLAAEGLGYKRVALLYPRLPKGVALINAFWDTYESLGGTVAAAESYDYDETTFMVPVRKLVGRHYLEARPEYVECMRKTKEVEAAYKRQKAVEACKESVVPVADFDAVFIADYHGPVGLIAPALAFEDVFVGNDDRSFRQFKQTTGRANARRVILLGTNGFNDKSLPARGGKYVQGALFVDGFNPADGRPETQTFLKAFAAATNARADLREAQAYDAARILGAVFAGAPRTRADFRERLGATRDFPAVIGPTTFDAQGGSVTPLHVFTIKNDQIIPAILDPRAGG